MFQMKQTFLDPTLARFYKDEYHVNDSQMGLYLMFLGLGTLLGSILTPIAANRYSIRAPMIIGNLATGVTFFFVAPTTHHGSLLCSVFALYAGGAFEQMVKGSLLAVLNDTVQDKYPKH